MTIAPKSLRSRLMAAGACGLVLSSIGTTVARADASTAQVNLGVGQDAPTQSESVVVKYKARLLREKNSPSAVTELGQQQINAVGIGSSPTQLLRQAPSVFVYQQGLGDNAPFITIRGVRGLEVATTLDGVPTQDLQAPNFYLANNIGSVFSLNQISGVHVYPGVASPDKNTFGTIGGTLAYDSKRPSKDFYFDVTGGIGSFGTYEEGFELNSGAVDSVFGTGDNAAKVLLSYQNFQSQGYIDFTPSRENKMEFALDKPYNDGLSNFQATVIYNQATGLIQNEPIPVPYLQKYGMFTNYPTDISQAKENNDFLTLILKDDTYVNDWLDVGMTAFYLANNNTLDDYGNINLMLPGGVAPTGQYAKYFAGGSLPFFNNPGGFGEGGYFGPPTGGLGGLFGTQPLGFRGGGYGGVFYGRGNPYNPYALYPVGSKGCPTSVVNAYGGLAGGAPCGLNDQFTQAHNDTYGIQPRATILVPEIFGIANTIKMGALIAKETSPSDYTYLGDSPNSPHDAAHAANNPTGGTLREIFQGYIQDRIDLLDNSLHVTPGVTIEGTYSAYQGSFVYRSKQSPYNGPTGLCGPNGYYSYYGICGPYGSKGGGNGTQVNQDRTGPYSDKKWDRETLPFLNVSYDFDKIMPGLAGLSVYASTGQSAVFAPVSDFGPRVTAGAPNASIVHLYEGGIKYNTSKLLLSADYFYQKIDRDFGFYSSQTGANFGASVYSSDGQREMKGVEAAVQYQITPEIQLFGNASYTLAKWLTTSLALDTVAEDQYGVVIKGSHVTGVPDYLATFGVDYAKKSLLLDNDSLDVRFTGQYTGHQYTTCDLQLAYPSCGNVYVQGVKGVDYSGGPKSDNVFDTFTGATTTDASGGISPYTTFSLDASYTLPTPQLPVLKKVTFDANIQNLFDQRYWQYFYKQISPSSCKKTPTNPTGNPYGCTPEFADGIPGQPFSVFFTITARF